MEKRYGFSSVIAIIFILVLIVVVAFAGKIVLSNMKKTNTNLLAPYASSVPSLTPQASTSPVSTSTDSVVIQNELNDTNVAPVDQDFKDLNSSASSLY